MSNIAAFILVMFISIAGYSQKVDSSLQYRWPNSLRDTMQWPLTYGWYDTTRLDKEEGVLWIMDTVTRKVLVEDSGWRVTERYPPPPNCRCIGKYIFHEFLDADKHPFSKTAYIKTSLDLYYEQHH